MAPFPSDKKSRAVDKRQLYTAVTRIDEFYLGIPDGASLTRINAGTRESPVAVSSRALPLNRTDCRDSFSLLEL